MDEKKSKRTLNMKLGTLKKELVNWKIDLMEYAEYIFFWNQQKNSAKRKQLSSKNCKPN